MEQVKVIKDILGLKKGTILTNYMDGDGNQYFMYLDGLDGNDSLEVSTDVVDMFIEKGYIIELNPNDKLDKITDLIESELKEYEVNYSNLISKYEKGEIQTCVKVEAETVYYNLKSVLNAILEIINN